MNPLVGALVLFIYFMALLAIAYLTGKEADTDAFFTGRHSSPWYLVAFGMLGASLSGITFISVPGNVGKIGMSYFQVAIGYLVGYWIIITILLPLYYRLQVVSIYTYLGTRFNLWAYRTGSFFFIMSRTIGSSLRLLLTASVLQLFLFDAWGTPFFLTVGVTLGLIWMYTFRGGIKTIVWTDTFQTLFLIGALVITVWQISDTLHLSFFDILPAMNRNGMGTIFHWDDPTSSSFFPKAFIGGVFVAVSMTGLDQELMQKNLTCRSLPDAQKNMFWLSILLTGVVFLFLVLGGLLYLYAEHNQILIPASSDELYPLLAMKYLPPLAGIFFLLGTTASSYASSDSALTGLTTSFCLDFLRFERKDEKTKQRQKLWVHLGFTCLFFAVILFFKAWNNRSLIDAVLNLAGYTYGPLLGMFSFGLFTKRQVKGPLILMVCLLSPLLSLGLTFYSPALLHGYQFGIELLAVNGFITFIGLWLCSFWEEKTKSSPRESAQR